MKLAMLCDEPGWCFERTGIGMEKYHNTGHTWKTLYARPGGHVHPTRDDFREFDVLRIGGVPLFRWFFENKMLGWERRVVPTVASFNDLIEMHAKWVVREKVKQLILGIIINDQRQLHDALSLDVPIIYSPDRVCQEIFRPMRELRPTDGPIRIGWAGSETYWEGVKNVNLIEQACREVKGVEFIRQDREKDGLKSPEEMARWLNSLDVYISANVERSCTPVTTLEAIACATPVITTRCGELWQPIQAALGDMYILDNGCELFDVKESIAFMRAHGREKLRNIGCTLHDRLGSTFVTWECGEAERITRALVKLRKLQKEREERKP